MSSAHLNSLSLPPVPGLRRYVTRKVKCAPRRVLYTDHPVPAAAKNAAQPKYSDLESRSDEFSHMRYTAVTVDPNDFTRENGYDLRPRTYNRHTELLVSVTYYNEDKVLLTGTTHSIMQNIRDIINLKKSTFWNKGGPAWQKTVLCIVMDGIEPCDKGALASLATEVEGREPTAHIFEYTTQVWITPDQKLIFPRDYGEQETLPPVCHAFGRLLNPKVVVHIDTGTTVLPGSVLTLWEAFYNDKDLGGASGSLLPMHGKWGKELLNPAFSAYRFIAVRGRPLEDYFHGDPTLAHSFGGKAASQSPFRYNRFLADDCVLPFNLVTKPGQRWRTRLVSRSVAETDVPTSTIDFINQRRRWPNGSLASSVHSLRMSYRLLFSDHSIPRLALLFFQIFHNLVSFLLTWFSLAGFLLTTFIVNDITGDPPAHAPVDGFPFGKSTLIINSIIQIIYLATIVLQFIIALGSRPRCHVVMYTISFSIFAIVQLYLSLNLVNLAKRIIDFKLDTNGSADYAYISEYYTDIGELTILASYLFISSAYINILKTYAFSNFQDSTWGHRSGKRVIRMAPIPAEPRISKTNHSTEISEQMKPEIQDVDAAFEQMVMRALTPLEAEIFPDEDDREAHFLDFRIKLVAGYTISNFIVCLVVMNDSFKSLSWLGDSYWHKVWFFRIYLGANSGLLMLQFTGCVYKKVVDICVSWFLRH
ncbi:glycosyltransferase family 2 protein [Xylaria venustula]|nr:glycosyltransferase family 2 protein [Xylaria venustula]